MVTNPPAPGGDRVSEGDSVQSGAPQGRSGSPEAFPEGAKGLPLARYLTPGLPRRRAPAGVNFPPAEGDRAPAPRPPTPQESDLLCSCHQRRAPGPPRSIHNPGPRPLQAGATPSCPPNSAGSQGGGTARAGSGMRGPWPLRAGGRSPSPETARHHGRGMEGPRTPRQAIAGTPCLPAHAPKHTPPSPRPGRLPLAQRGKKKSSQAAARSPRGATAALAPLRRRRRHRQQPHTPASAMFGALRGRRAGAPGPRRKTARGSLLCPRSPRPVPGPRPHPAPPRGPPSFRLGYSREITAQRVG